MFRAKCDWVAGAREAQMLMERCVWSPTLFHYLYYGFALMANEGKVKSLQKCSTKLHHDTL